VRALLLRPEIFLFDEITASLDSISKQSVENTLNEWHKAEGTAMVWVTHEPEQARRVTDRIWFLAEGRLLEDTDTRSFFMSPATEAGRAYVHTPAEGAV
jgi:putative ABC transport system ATP-binding protein